MGFKEDFRQLVRPYYWVNILLSICYVTCKRTPLVCGYLFPESDCELDSRETEILFFLVIVVMLRTRKAGSVTMVNYLSSSFVYTKVANLILWFYADVRYGLCFGALFILCGLVLPEPTYTGPEHVTYFRGHESLEEELRRSGAAGAWLVCVFAAWHPACVTLAPLFAELSAAYGNGGLRFGKLDVGRYPAAAAKYRISDAATSRQLPTLILFKGGKETARRPQADSSGKLQKFLFSKDNIKASFDLDGVYEECKKATAARENETGDKKTQ